MSTFLERINTDNTCEIHLETGSASFGSRKLPKNETFVTASIPIDRHRFSHFSKYLSDFTLKVSKNLVDSCNTDCKRQLNYIHGKNVNLSDDLLELCQLRCDTISKNYHGEILVFLFILFNKIESN